MRIITTFLFVFVAAGTLSCTIAEEQILSEDELIESIPGLSYILSYSGFNISSLQIDKQLRERCEKNSGSSAFGAARQGLEFYGTCLRSLVNPTKFRAEIEYARPHGDMDEVFGKYCLKVPDFKNCVRNVTTMVDPCLDSEEHKNINVIHNITDSVLKFICHGEGGRIAMFIAAGGIECLEKKRQSVSTCAKESFNGYVPATNTAAGSEAPPVTNTTPQLVLGLKQCLNMAKFRTCAVDTLEECKDPTPANVLDSLLNFVKKSTPCQKLLMNEETHALGRSGSPTNIINFILVTTAMAMSLRFA